MKATIYDVAREAGVSIAAVSQVINGKGKISEERRNEIMRVMERLQYKPSYIASALTGKKTHTLGLIVPDISNPFFAEIARAVEDEGHRQGYSVFICSTDNDDDRLEWYLTQLGLKSVDGIIIGTGMADEEMLNSFIKKTVPVTMVARELPNVDVQTVIVDDYAGGALAARHLLALGHTRAAVLAEHPRIISSRERIRGFQEVFSQAGAALPENWVKSGSGDLVRDGRRHARDLLLQMPRPSAIFCCNDLLAIGALQAAKEAGLRVPEDLSIVGFDNTILATVTDPALTTVSQPTEVMGKMAVSLILQSSEPPAEMERRVVLQPELIIRQSTAPPYRA